MLLQIHQKPEILKITSLELASSYVANEINADKRYKGLMIELTGVIYNISDVLGSQNVTLQGQDFDNVLCYCKSGQKDKLAKLQKGQTITLVGIVDGYSLMTVVKDCEIR